MMITMFWTDQYSVKVREFDEQHKRFIDMINSLYRAMSAGAGEAAPLQIIAEMADYAEVHFAAEEKYMEQFGFPGCAEHVKEHKLFIEKVRKLQKEAEQKGFVLTLEVLQYLKEWLKDHVLGTDMKYVTFFNEHGLK